MALVLALYLIRWDSSANFQIKSNPAAGSLSLLNWNFLSLRTRVLSLIPSSLLIYCFLSPAKDGNKSTFRLFWLRLIGKYNRSFWNHCIVWFHWKQKTSSLPRNFSFNRGEITNLDVLEVETVPIYPLKFVNWSKIDVFQFLWYLSCLSYFNYQSRITKLCKGRLLGNSMKIKFVNEKMKRNSFL